MRTKPMLGLLVVGAGLVLGAVAPGTASAGSTGLPARVVVERTGALGTTDKEAVVACPAGTKVYSAGGRINGAPAGTAIITRVMPAGDLSQVVVGARAVEAAMPWSITAYAVCGRGAPVLVRSTPGMSAQGVQLRSASASCADVGALTGVGGEVVDPAKQATLFGLVPDQDLRTATAGGSGPVDGQWKVQAWAICDSAVVGKTALVTGVSGPLMGAWTQTASATCAPGWQLLGGGGTAKGNSTDAVASLIAVQPEADTETMTASGTKGASPWYMEAYAICAKE